MLKLNKEQNIHFIGIGGIGMSGIAKILLESGYCISGSDLNESETSNKLQQRGAKIYLGHHEENIENVQVIVYSSAIDQKNPEIKKAIEMGIPIIKRAAMLAKLMEGKKAITVAGSHGKTTTTSFLSTILKELDYDPSCIVGGVVNNLGSNACSGKSDLLVAEADESDGSFLLLTPWISVLTNIDNDHLDFYETIENLENAFVEFFEKIPQDGFVVLNAHDKTTGKILKQIEKSYFSFALEEEERFVNKVDYLVTKIKHSTDGMTFELSYKNESIPFSIKLSGRHNILNALGAIIVAHQLGTSLDDISSVIGHFSGVGRRLEKLKEQNNFIVIDDYAHHPTELEVTLTTLKRKFPSKKLVAIFEPHRYSRTQNFWNEFVDVFRLADEVYISPIYPASEDPIMGIEAEKLVEEIGSKYKNAFFLSDLASMDKIFEKYKDTDCLVATLGAGPISKVARKILNA